MMEDPNYQEKVTSKRTEAIFIVLMLLFLSLFASRVTAIGFGPSTTVFFCLFSMFLFYSFMKRKYRAMFNFLEHQRVVLLLSKKKGLVQEIAFSTRRPEDIKQIISNNCPNTFD